jgi:hypothetical protein
VLEKNNDYDWFCGHQNGWYDELLEAVKKSNPKFLW